MEPVIALVRRYVVDWLSRGDTSVCEEILDPDYTLRIGGHVLAGREAYVQATVRGLLEKWPGVGVTVHEVVCAGPWAAARMTEHGPSAKDGSVAAWGIVTLFESDGTRLVRAWAEEDYAARHRQLTDGVCDPIDAPASAPWATISKEGDWAAEQVTRAWVAGEVLDGVILDDGWLGHDTALPGCGDPAGTRVDALFSAGPRVAFHAVREGQRPLSLAGIVEVQGARVAGGRVIRDRLGLRCAQGAKA